MWSGRTIAVTLALAAGCASLPPPPASLPEQVSRTLERRGLGPDALRVIDNLVRHGPPAPRGVPALVGELLARPLDALDTAALFRRSVPAALGAIGDKTQAREFDELLEGYLVELAQAQQLLRAASRPFDEDAVWQQLTAGLPPRNALPDVTLAVDAEAVRRANLAFVEATAGFARAVSNARGIREARVFETRSATVVIGTRGNDVHQLSPVRSGRIHVLIDPGGDDEYRGSDLALNGFSAIIDLGGNDRYRMDGPGLGAAVAGAALLLDFAGDDSYEAGFFAQGAAAVFGLGALLDLGGNDRYRIDAWGQGFGIGDGVGLLWDRRGNDRYLAGGVPDAFNRAGGLSGAQGTGFGYRSGLAGGIGILRDDAGDDLYEAQMFAQGVGYYYGLGLLWERGGSDQYRALQYAQGNGVHQAIGLLREDSGNDSYQLATAYGQGMGLDIAFGALVDESGDDSYRAHNIAQGAGTANGFGLLADQTGADRFAIGPVAHTWGHAEWMRGLPTLAVLLHGPHAQFTRDGRPASPEPRPLAVQAMTAAACPSEDPSEALLCKLKDASPAQASEIAALLAARPSCTMRALALRSWPTLPAAESALRSDCLRLQAAGAAAFARLARPLPPDVVLPSFLRGITPPEDTY